jgi:translation initiation factor 2 alpha subunit (eIF-2alpha)
MNKQWQELTDDEIDDIIKNVFSKSTIEIHGVKTCSVRDGVRAIEQALKEKNHGI